MIGETLSHYRIIKRLGAGGMGEVYLAQDTTLDRRVAIKLLPPECVEDQILKKRLMREARVAAKLDHPNICAIHEVGEQDGRSFIVMQYLEGETLAAAIESRRLSLAESLDLALQIADALSEAHSQGIIHRDIKPHNIIITPRGQAKVLDFGLARSIIDLTSSDSGVLTESLLTEPGTVVGTVPYMSPEQVRGEVLDSRTDIFSFGALLYEMISNKSPFVAGSATATLSAILTRNPDALARYAPETPAELQRIVSKALRKDKEQRYQTARDAMLDLKSLKQELELRAQLGPSALFEAVESVASGSGNKLGNKPDVDSEVSSVSTARGGLASLLRGRGSLGLLAAALLALVFLGVYLGRGGSEQQSIDSIAVLPFINANADPNTEYLSDGIPESIINSLSRLSRLKVMSRNSVFRYKGLEADAQTVGRELKVAAVLTGRVTQLGGNLGISIELVKASDGSQIWGQQYNRPLADVFAIQGEIAREVSEKLRVTLSGAEKQNITKRYTDNIKAFQYYTQGRSHLGLRTRDELLTAINYYEKAIAEDDKYALAYAGLAEVYANLGGRGYVAARDGRQRAEAAVQKALALDENLAEAHLATGEISVLFGPFNLARADRALQRALELSPGLASVHQYLGNSYVLRGRYDEALQEFLKARELDPLSSILARLVVGPYYYRRDYARALELLRQANELRPSYLTLWEVGVYIKNGAFDEALAEMEKEKQQRKDDVILIESAGKLYAAQGRRAQALEVIKELEAMSGPDRTQAQYIAAIYAVLGEKELAFDWLNRALETGAIWFFIKDDPLWDPIRSDPRFGEDLARMNLTQ